MSEAQTAVVTEARTALKEGLVALLGAEHVLTDPVHTVFHSTDIFTPGALAGTVVSPGSTEEVSEVVRLCVAAGVPVIPKGAGYSYTKGYIPTAEGAVIVDLRRLDRIVEINAEDMYVTVQCGCTWVALYEALKAKGLRTPYFGPLSGYRATIGGGLAQGSFFLGSTQYGVSAETVLALEVVLADGSVVRTGSAGGPPEAAPNFRNYGPDLTGLFLGDSGALGFKITATLKLIQTPAHTGVTTFSFQQRAQAIEAMSRIARAGLATECYIWDPIFGKKAESAASFKDKLKYLRQVYAAAGNPITGTINAARLALRGSSAFSGKANLLHVTADDPTAQGAAGRIRAINAIAETAGGRWLEPAAPRAMRAHPFHDFAAHGQKRPELRNLPMHGIFAHSKVQAANVAMEKLLAERSEEMTANGVTAGAIFFAIGSQSVCIEPLLYWKDPQLALYDRIAETADVEGLKAFPERPAAAQVVQSVRQGLIDLFAALGASHAQIGKTYPYAQTRQGETLKLLRDVKVAVDPKGLVNPGALGL